MSTIRNFCVFSVQDESASYFHGRKRDILKRALFTLSLATIYQLIWYYYAYIIKLWHAVAAENFPMYGGSNWDSSVAIRASETSGPEIWYNKAVPSTAYCKSIIYRYCCYLSIAQAKLYDVIKRFQEKYSVYMIRHVLIYVRPTSIYVNNVSQYV